MKKVLSGLAVVMIGAFLGAIPAAASTHKNYPLGAHATTCRVDYHKVNRERIVHVGRRHYRKHYIECVYRAPVPASLTVPAPGGTTLPSTTTPTVAPTLAVSLDPTFTQNATQWLQATFSYSVSATISGVSQSPPAGALEFFVDGSLAQSINVSAQSTSGQVTTTFGQYGNHTVDTVYDSGSNSATTGNESVSIEPPAETVNEMWGTTSPTSGAAVSATVQGSSASVSVTDPNWEGPTGTVTLTDNLSDACNLSVIGTTGNCTMSVTGTPSSFTIGYPGGTSTQGTQAVAPNGTQPVTYAWPSESVPVSHPTVTVQSATVVWNNYRVNSGSYQSVTNPINVTSGQSITINAYASGSLSNDTIGMGGIDFVFSPSGSYTMTDGQPASSSVNCSDSFNYSSQAVGVCVISFSGPGTYTLQPNYLSSDANYQSVDGPTITINVAS